jgi:drug/metabolite transporter (DMT)-like permease
MIDGARQILAAALLFSLMSLFVKLAGQRLPSLEIVLVRSVVTLILSFALLKRSRIPIWGKNHLLLALRGIFGFAALSAFFYSVTQLPLAEATVIQFTNPVFTAIFAAFFLGEKTSSKLWLSILLSFGGVLAITRPAILFGQHAGDGHIAPTVVVLGLAGAMATGIAYVLVRKLAALENEMVIVFYFPLIAVPGSALLLREWIQPTPKEWLLMIAVGITAQWGQIYLTRGMQRLAAAKATVVLYSQLVFAAAWGLLFLGQPPGILTVAGAALVLAGSLLTAKKTAPAADTLSP